MSAVLAMEGLGFTFPGARERALDAVDLEVGAGEFVVLTGPSGSGKSTLVRAGCGLVPHASGGTVAGRVVVGGLDTREHGPAALAAVAGTLLQDPEAQVVLATVRSELALPLEHRGLGAAAVARGVEEAALALGLAGLLDRATHELSGGELQRVALGGALAGRPRLLLLDEPTAQLDPVAADELLGLLRRLNEEWGVAIVLAEHRLERCLTSADRVVSLDRGRIAFDGDVAAYLEWAARAAPAALPAATRLVLDAGLRPLPAGVKAARAVLAAHGLLEPPPAPAPAPAPPPAAAPVLRVERAWVEPRGAAPMLRGASLALVAGERVALMGRNGAGKSTLLRVAAGLAAPSRGRVRCDGRVGLLLQNPGDYLVHERVADEAPADALERVGLGQLAGRHPRDLSGGERQRLALAVVLGGDEPPVALLLDEPTRGMDRTRKARLGALLGELAAAGTAIVVATHDAEWAAEVAERVVLLAEGTVIADAPVAEVLGGGWYFATETARVLGGAPITPAAGAAALRTRMRAPEVVS